MSAATHASSQQHRDGPSASTVTLHFRRGSEVRRVTLPARSVRIGSSPKEDLVLPSAWAKPHHLIIEYDAGLARIRTCDPAARALLGAIPITSAGIMFPPGGVITIPSAEGLSITIECEFHMHAGVMLIDDSSTASTHIPPVEIAGVSPLDETKSLFAMSAPISSATQQRKKSWPRQSIALCGVGVAVGIVLAALYWNEIHRAFLRSNVDAAFAQVVQDISQAQALIKQGQYVEAKSLIDDAARITSAHPAFADQILVLRAMSASPEIKFGGLGYVHIENQWLPPETAAAWKTARLRDDPQITSLLNQARSALAADTDLETAEQSCAQALALMAAEPVHPHPLQQEVTALRGQIHNRLIITTMTARGFVLYHNRWVTPAERFRLEQEAKGLALYKGKWISKSAAFTAQQTDRGLILYHGQWMTPDDAEMAQGLVKFEGAWITPQHRIQIIQQRQTAADLTQKRAEQARLAAAQKAEQQAKEQEAIEAKYSDAYQQSQKFVKDILKSPTSAQFQPFGNPKVHVTYAKGWYTVVAVVDAQNAFGVLLRSTYFCKLKPSGPDQWQANTTYLMDN